MNAATTRFYTGLAIVLLVVVGLAYAAGFHAGAQSTRSRAALHAAR